MTQTINYGMTRDYRKTWTAVEAIREIVQNCLDNELHESTFERRNGSVRINTIGYILPMRAFALGESTKGDDDIGGFGEGFKLALLVLAREGLKPVLFFGKYTAVAYFEEDEIMGVETFRIDITQMGGASEDRRTCFMFDLPEDQFKEVQHRISVFADKPLPYDAFKVSLLRERAGDIFVNGLFVCNEPRLKFGYNFPPSLLQLGCDRQIANGLGVAWETSKYWANNVDDGTEMLRLMTDEVLDVSDIHYHISERAAKKVTEAFNAKFGDVTIKPMGSTLSHGMSLGGSLYNTVKKSGYTQVANPHEEKGTPYTVLMDFILDNKKHMRRKALVELNKIIAESKKWKK